MRLITANEYREILGLEHATEEARKKYLKEHPKADPKKHTVKDKGDSKQQGNTPSREHLQNALGKELELDAATAKEVFDKAEAKLKGNAPRLSRRPLWMLWSARVLSPLRETKMGSGNKSTTKFETFFTRARSSPVQSE